MSKLEFTVHCPVCKMTKVDRSLLFNYRGIDHYFCSSQCLDRFKAHPHLFVGDPKHGLSPKQKGQKALKKRRIGFSEPIDEDLKAVMEQSLLSLMGIESLLFEETFLYVTYDLLQVSLEEIEAAIDQSPGKLKSGVADRIKRGFIHYSEECELDNLAHLTSDHGHH